MYHQISAATFNIYRFLVPNSDRNIGYVLECKNTKKCLIFDPLDKDIIDKILDDNDLKPEYILNTHAHPDLFRTIHHKIKYLSDDLVILPGHDYLNNNLNFLNNLVSVNQPILEELKEIQSECLDSDLSSLKTISFEKRYNPFFRIDELSFLDILLEPEVFKSLTMEERFIKLRSLRDNW